MKKKLKTILILVWIVALYIVHYYYEYKKYIGILQN